MLNVQTCNRFEFSHSSSLLATATSHFVHSSLVDQLYVKEVYFCSFVTKSNNLVYYAPNIHPNVFDSFHRTVINGESNGIFTCPSPSILTFHYRTSFFCYLPFFFFRTLKTIEKQIHFIPSGETISNRIWSLTCYPSDQ